MIDKYGFSICLSAVLVDFSEISVLVGVGKIFLHSDLVGS